VNQRKFEDGWFRISKPALSTTQPPLHRQDQVRKPARFRIILGRSAEAASGA
jgi:hypothetical protein